MKLIDEEDDLSLGLLDFVKNGFQTLLELTSELCARNKAAHIEGEDSSVTKIYGDISTDDTLCKTLNDSGLTNARLTDDNRVVLGLTGKDTDNVSYFGISADNRVKLVSLCEFNEVLTVFFQYIVGVIGVVAQNSLVSSYLGESVEELVFIDAESLENHADRVEVKQALEYGEGESTRYSSTLLQKTMYCAERLADGSVLRISMSRATAGVLLVGMGQPILVVLIVALILSSVLAKSLSHRIVQPLNKLDLEHPLENDAY